MFLYTDFFVICVVICSASADRPQFRVIKEWKYINFTWPDDESLQSAIAKGLYIPESNIMAGVHFYEDYYYLALPRMRDGVPATLARIPVEGSNAPLLEPFPSWEMNSLGDCNTLQNVQNLEIDDKGRAWIIDGGRTSTLTLVQNSNCPPKLIIYDIKANETITRYTFPESTVNKSTSFLYDIVVDNTDGGYAYITDNSKSDPGIIVYSLKRNRSWKIRHSRTMRADPSATDFKVNGTSISSPINIGGIALGPRIHSREENITLIGDRAVYYCPISSLHLYSISSTVLQNESSVNTEGEYEGLVRDVGIKASQTDGMMMDNKGTLYYGLLGISGIAMWDSSKPFAYAQRVIGKDATYIQWPNSFAFDNKGNIIALTNKLQKYVYGLMNLDEPNFRLLSANTGGKSYVYEDDNLIYITNESPRDINKNVTQRNNNSELDNVSQASNEPQFHTTGNENTMNSTDTSSANKLLCSVYLFIITMCLIYRND